MLLCNCYWTDVEIHISFFFYPTNRSNRNPSDKDKSYPKYSLLFLIKFFNINREEETPAAVRYFFINSTIQENPLFCFGEAMDSSRSDSVNRNTKKNDGDDDTAQNEEALYSVERIFESKEVPSWQDQLTLRAFCVSFILGILFTFIVLKLSLTTGIIPSLNVSAGLLGFFFIKTWTKLLEKSGVLKQPFTRQENTVIQTCVVATSGIAFSGKYSRVFIFFSLSQVFYQTH